MLINLNIRNYAQTLVECLPIFAYTEKEFYREVVPFLKYYHINFYELCIIICEL